MIRPASLLSCVLLAACSLLAPASAQEEGVLFENGRILLQDAHAANVGALLVRGGVVLAAGMPSEVATRAEAQGARHMDLAGAVAVPGMQDAAVDLERQARALDWIDLSACADYQALIERLRAAAAALPEGTWIFGRGWDQNLWTDQHLPHNLLLSAQLAKHPVYLEHAAGDLALVNGAALALAHLDGVLDPEPRIAGGHVVCDAEHRATGLLLGAARELVLKFAPAPSSDELRAAFLRLQADYLSRGLTCVHDQGTRPVFLKLLEGLRRDGKLHLRVVCYAALGYDANDKLVLPTRREDLPLELLTVAGVHLDLDGTLSTRSAALIEPYAHSEERGALWYEEDKLVNIAANATRGGLALSLSAHGDRAVRQALDALERIASAMPESRDLRSRVIGAELVAPKDWPRFPGLGVVCVLDPKAPVAQAPWIEAAVGIERVRCAAVWRSLAPELRRLCFGALVTANTGGALAGLANARARPTVKGLEGLSDVAPIDGESLLAGFTIGSAWSVRQDEHRGRLAPGSAADLTVFSIDPLRATPEQLAQASVRYVVINGVVVWHGH